MKVWVFSCENHTEVVALCFPPRFYSVLCVKTSGRAATTTTIAQRPIGFHQKLKKKNGPLFETSLKTLYKSLYKKNAEFLQMKMNCFSHMVESFQDMSMSTVAEGNTTSRWQERGFQETTEQKSCCSVFHPSS